MTKTTGNTWKTANQPIHEKTHIDIYGLGVMGRNLALNFNNHEFAVSVYNRNLPGEEDLIAAFLPMKPPANLTQAQCHYFGAHQYERLDRPTGTFLHTDWTGGHRS